MSSAGGVSCTTGTIPLTTCLSIKDIAYFKMGQFFWWTAILICFFLLLSGLSTPKPKTSWKQAVPHIVGLWLAAEMFLSVPFYWIDLSVNRAWRIGGDAASSSCSIIGSLFYLYFGYLRVSAMNHPLQIFLKVLIPVVGVCRILLSVGRMLIQLGRSGGTFYFGTPLEYFQGWYQISLNLQSAYYGLDLMNVIIDAFVGYVILSRKQQLSTLMSQSSGSSNFRNEHIASDINRSFLLISLMCIFSLIHSILLFVRLDDSLFYYVVFYSLRFALAELYNTSFTNAIFEQKF